MKRIFVAGCLLSLVLVCAGQADEKKKNGKEIFPGFPSIESDPSLLEIRDVFKITKAGVELKAKVPVAWWVLEVQADGPNREEVKKTWGVAPSDDYNRGPRVFLKDADKVTIAEGQLILQGFHDRLKKGDGVRVIMELPPPQILERTKYVVFSN